MWTLWGSPAAALSPDALAPDAGAPIANPAALAPGSVAPVLGQQQKSNGAAKARGDDPWRACLEVADQIEREEKLPEQMLAAVTTVETGWGQPGGGKTRYPWPWTVTAQGRGQHFQNKQAAIDAVRGLLASGVSSIDVGCMQINLYYHPRAFTGLEEAFEPKANVRYAVGYLRQLKGSFGSWESALEHYHSYDPNRRQDYRGKVFAAWQDAQARRDRFLQASGISDAPLGAETRVSAHFEDGPLLGDRASREDRADLLEFPGSWLTPAPITISSADMIVPLDDDRGAKPPARRATGPRVIIPVDLSPRPSDRFNSNLDTAETPSHQAAAPHDKLVLAARPGGSEPAAPPSLAE